MNPFVTLLIQEMPSVIQSIKDRHAALNPTLPPLTDEEAAQMLKEAVDATVAKDDRWLAVHGTGGTNATPKP